MTSSKGASSAESARPFDFPMFSTIQHPKHFVTNVDIGRIRVEVSPRAL
jgi:hypothetical protein